MTSANSRCHFQQQSCHINTLKASLWNVRFVSFRFQLEYPVSASCKSRRRSINSYPGAVIEPNRICGDNRHQTIGALYRAQVWSVATVLSQLSVNDHLTSVCVNCIRENAVDNSSFQWKIHRINLNKTYTFKYALINVTWIFTTNNACNF